MNILIIGSGGREHALAWAASRDQDINKVFVAPGNAATAIEAGMQNIDIDPMDMTLLADFAANNQIALTIVGPEAPLVEGIVDLFQARNLAIFGPSKAAAQLEGSKIFSKDFLARNNIPSAEYQSFTELQPALSYLKTKGAPIVIKADGLAAGKGVIVATSIQQAEEAVKDMLSDNKFGEAGSRVVIEDFLQGEEASFIVMTDGDNVLPMATSQDHKPIGNGDTGPNTGGMGAYSPAPVVTPAVHQRIMDEIIYPTIKAMKAEGNEYTGFLYAGLMITPEGAPQVIEYNCRFGDPETQPIMLRLKSSLVKLCQAALAKELDKTTAEWDERKAVGVVMAAEGYPNSYSSGTEIKLPEEPLPYCKIFHAGTKYINNKLVSAGGRVLCVTALGDNITQAQHRAYELIKQIEWQDAYFRSDIGYRAIEREKTNNN